MKGKKISLLTDCPYLHVDVELVRIKKPTSITVKPGKGYLEFLTGH
jgi:hypothetical protein